MFSLRKSCFVYRVLTLVCYRYKIIYEMVNIIRYQVVNIYFFSQIDLVLRPAVLIPIQTFEYVFVRPCCFRNADTNRSISTHEYFRCFLQNKNCLQLTSQIFIFVGFTCFWFSLNDLAGTLCGRPQVPWRRRWPKATRVPHPHCWRTSLFPNPISIL